ncbi:MAG: hypothetical protein P8Y23_14725 [Candidatus Lokiarchaeota archaeon]|jgi:hypothetical protein
MDESEERKKEEFAKQFMAEEGFKGKAKRIMIMKIIDTVGFNKNKIKVALLRSTIKERIYQD